MHHQRDYGKASEALRKARFVLVCQDGHKPPLVEAYRGPYKIKSRSNYSYLLEGGHATGPSRNKPAQTFPCAGKGKKKSTSSPSRGEDQHATYNHHTIAGPTQQTNSTLNNSAIIYKDQPSPHLSQGPVLSQHLQVGRLDHRIIFHLVEGLQTRNNYPLLR